MLSFKKKEFFELNFSNVFLFIILVTLIRLISLFYTPLGLSVDEAQYWDWSKTPEFGYFSKPPLISWLISFTTFFFGDAEWAIRLGSPILHALISFMLWLITKKLYGSSSANLSAVIWITLPITSFGSLIISTDTPLLFFWCLSFYSLLKLFETKGHFWSLMLGISLGLGLLTKYAILFFIIGLFLSIVDRRIFKEDLYKIFISFIVFLIVISPNIHWNLVNNLSTVNHTVYNANLANIDFNLLEMMRFIISQFLIFGPIFLFLYIFRILKYNTLQQKELFLVYFSLPIFLIIILQAFLTTSNANWAATALPTSVVLISGLATRTNFFLNGILKLGIIINICVLIFLLKTYIFGNLYPIHLASDPLRKLKGYPFQSKEMKNLIDDNKPSAIIFLTRNDISKFTYYLKLHENDSLNRYILTRRINPINHYEYKYNFKNSTLRKGDIVLILSNNNGLSSNHLSNFSELKTVKKIQFIQSNKTIRIHYVMKAIIK